MKKIIVFGVLTVILTLTLSLMASEKHMKNDVKESSLICCFLSCTVLDNQIWAEVTISNATASTVAVFERNLLKTNDLTWAAFQVLQGGKEVPYTGLAIKRQAPRADEFYRMKPHEVLKAKIELSKFYNFSKLGDYVIKYVTVNPLFETQDLFVMESESVLLHRK